ncbi:MAG: hypothetical protein V1718_04000 [archaeon]
MRRKLLLILALLAIVLISGCTGETKKEIIDTGKESDLPKAFDYPKAASTDGPLDTALAEITILSVDGDTSKMRIEKIIDYVRYPGATYHELESGEELTIMVYYLAEETSGTTPKEGKKYLAQLSICYNDYIGGLGCGYDGWSGALYSL